MWDYFSGPFLKEQNLILDPIEPFVYESYK